MLKLYSVGEYKLGRGDNNSSSSLLFFGLHFLSCCRYYSDCSAGMVEHGTLALP